MKTDDLPSNIEKGVEILIGEYYALSSRISIEITTFRVIAFAWLVIAIATMKYQPTQFVALTIASFFTSLLWGLIIRSREQNRLRLERVLIDFFLQVDNGDFEKLYVVWKHEDWKHHSLARILSIEPLLWALITFGLVVIKMFI